MERTQPNPDNPDPVASFVAVLLQCTGQLTMIIDHMVRCGEEASGTPERSMQERLTKLLTDVLSDELSGRAEGVAAAVAIVEQASEIIGREVFLVSPDYGSDCRPQRGRGRQLVLRCRKMATEIPQRELRNNTADLLRRVERGERLRITVHGHPVADLVPANRPAEFVPFTEVHSGLAGLLGADDRLDRELPEELLAGEAEDPFARYDEIAGRAGE